MKTDKKHTRYYRYREIAIQEWEKKFLLKYLEQWGWNVLQTADYLGMARPNLIRKMHILGIKREPCKVIPKPKTAGRYKSVLKRPDVKKTE